MSVCPQKKSLIESSESVHIPGYAGYVPQLGYRCGKTFGSDTHELLRDPKNTKSSYSVLSNINKTVRTPEQIDQERRQEIMDSRTSSWGDQKFTDPMVPGYTGVIPRIDFYEGKTFSVAAFNGITDFENRQRRQRQKKNQLKAINALQSGKDIPEEIRVNLPPLLTKNRMPLHKIRQDMQDYFSPAVFRPKLNVYKLPNEDKDKCYVAGYMGFVPRMLERFGKDYENVTHEGLNEFTDELKKREVVLSTPVTVNRKEMRKVGCQSIYSTTGGLIPKYTGNVPGGKYKFGKTYWEMTYNAKDKFSPEMSQWSLQQRTVAGSSQEMSL